MRVVLDTNVVVSGLLSAYGPPARIVDLVVTGDLVLLFDDRLLSEYEEVLRRSRFGFDAVDVDALLNVIFHEGEAVVPQPLDLQLPDPDDQPFAEVAIVSKAEALITGNIRHFRPLQTSHGVKIYSPSAFLTHWRSGVARNA